MKKLTPNTNLAKEFQASMWLAVIGGVAVLGAIEIATVLLSLAR